MRSFDSPSCTAIEAAWPSCASYVWWMFRKRDFQHKILLSDEAYFWLIGYNIKQTFHYLDTVTSTISGCLIYFRAVQSLVYIFFKNYAGQSMESVISLCLLTFSFHNLMALMCDSFGFNKTVQQLKETSDERFISRNLPMNMPPIVWFNTFGLFSVRIWEVASLRL